MINLIYDMRILGPVMHGMARYGLELLRALLDQEPGLSVGVLVRRPEDAKLLPADKRLVAMALDIAPYGLRSQTAMPGFLARLQYDIFHCPFYAPPWWRKTTRPQVFTIHDLIHLRFPKDHGLKHRLFYRLFVAPAARRAEAVFTVSEHSKKDIVELLGVSPRRVKVVPNGVGPQFSGLDRAAIEPCLQELGLPRDYILGVGNPKPHKNLAALIKAHAGLVDQRGRENTPPLVLVGIEPGQVAGARPGDDLILPGYLDDSQLPLVYAGARMVVMPSLYEGFGLPVLEAMAAGAPVVASNRAALPEVAGEAGLLCEPDAEGLGQAMARVLDQGGLAEELAQAGRERAANFTWQRAAKATLEAYDHVLRGKLP